jgi:hypothetical protein
VLRLHAMPCHPIPSHAGGAAAIYLYFVHVHDPSSTPMNVALDGHNCGSDKSAFLLANAGQQDGNGMGCNKESAGDMVSCLFACQLPKLALQVCGAGGAWSGEGEEESNRGRSSILAPSQLFLSHLFRCLKPFENPDPCSRGRASIRPENSRWSRPKSFGHLLAALMRAWITPDFDQP